MIELFRQALLVQRFIEERDWEFCFIGGLALQRWGEPRATRAIDLTLFTDFGREMEFMDPLLAAFRPRIDDAREFAREYRVLLLRTPAPASVEVDVALAGLPFEAEMIARAVQVEFRPGVQLRVCTAEDLFVLKAFADRPQDRADILGIARRSGRELMGRGPQASRPARDAQGGTRHHERCLPASRGLRMTSTPSDARNESRGNRRRMRFRPSRSTDWGFPRRSCRQTLTLSA